jgi:hypothetical protein
MHDIQCLFELLSSLEQGGAVLIIAKQSVQPYFRFIDPLFLSRNGTITHAATCYNVQTKLHALLRNIRPQHDHSSAIYLPHIIYMYYWPSVG